MVVDNAPCHSNIEEVFSEEVFLGCEVLRLGPYSPMFNAIEQVWSLIKAYVKQELAAKILSILAMERRDGLSITEQRARALTSLIEEELGRVTPEACNRFRAGIQSKIPAAEALDVLCSYKWLEEFFLMYKMLTILSLKLFIKYFLYLYL